MHHLSHSRLGVLKILSRLSLFSDAVCIKRMSSAEFGFTQVALAIALGKTLAFSDKTFCDLIELCLFNEIPKVYLGDPSYYLRTRHEEAFLMYQGVQERVWAEMELSFRLSVTRDPSLHILQELLEAFSAQLFIEKECRLGNQYFASELSNNSFTILSSKLASGSSISQKTLANGEESAIWDRQKVLAALQQLRQESLDALDEGGLGGYASTYLGMVEKLREHFRYKGWCYVFPESVAEHTYQVLFLVFVISNSLALPPNERRDLYTQAALHDLPEGYASDVIYPIKIREKDLGALHQRVEQDILEQVAMKWGISLECSGQLKDWVDICDRFCGRIYGERETKAGNAHFIGMEKSYFRTRDRFQSQHHGVINILEELWQELLLSQKPSENSPDS
jgi:5'-deoxynucleotidase YfbR-like HD superfamily hydrolase